MSDFVNKHFSGKKTISDAVAQIYYLASAFYATGNTSMCDDLQAIAAQIDSGSKEMESAWNGLFDQAVRSSQEATGNMILAAISSINVALNDV